MPLGAVCVSTVSSRPRTWASYSNIRAKDVQGLANMNSTEEIAKYREPTSQYYSPTFSRRVLGCGYDLPEKSQKKEKKWSIGSLFRRKKKGGSESSSEEDKKGFLNRRRKKPERRRKSIKPVGTFDHVVIPPGQRLYVNGNEDPGILSDPTAGFHNYANRALPRIPAPATEPPSLINSTKTSKESLDDINNSRLSMGSGSADGSGRKTRRELAKARAEAKRTSLKHDSSSDDDSQRSASSSKFRSDESLSKHHSKDVSGNRKTRSARTERYYKRHSRDGENPKDYLRLSKSDAESSIINWKMSDESNRSPSRSPLPPTAINRVPNFNNNISSQSNISGLSTIPPGHGNLYKYRISNSTSNPSYKPPLSMNEYNNITKKYQDYNTSKLISENTYGNQRSASYDANIHKAQCAEMAPEVMHVQFPISKPNARHRNLSLIDASQLNRHLRQPPPPPPRDPKRLIATHYQENERPNTCFFDNTGQTRSQSFNINNNISNHIEPRKFSSFNLNPNFRSTSEDYLPKDSGIQLIQRPSSTTPESTTQRRYLNKKLEFNHQPENYQYLTDKKPRSRKPIFIQHQQASNNDENAKNNEASSARKVIDFWRQKDQEGLKQNEVKANVKKSGTQSPQMFTCQTHVETRVFLPSVLQNGQQNFSADNKEGMFGKDIEGKVTYSPVKTHTNENYKLNHKENVSDSINNNYNVNNTGGSLKKYFICNNEENGNSSGDGDEHLTQRKSSNLEEALNELEAIYNSLKLGDEDLLERAEKRERDAAVQNLLEKNIDPCVSWGISRGALSDSSFSYEPFDSLDSPRRKRLARRSAFDKKLDDMAYRKMNKERASTIGDPQSVLSKVSYLLASPIHNDDVDEDVKRQKDEPDITFDDVVYRNVKHANNTLKVTEPQPPFGIPIGPITPGANSDYLHAVPEDTFKPTYKRRKIPDIVKDDLAFRNLRKDPNKEEPALPPLSPEDFTNNNSMNVEQKLDLNSLKKRRAVRSLSANIGSLMYYNPIESSKRITQNNNNQENEFNNLTDIADAMEIARQVLKEKENRISATRRAFLSDTDTNTNTNTSKNINYPLSATDSLTDDKFNFLNELKGRQDENLRKSPNSRRSPRLGDELNGKPPKGLTADRRARSPHKESTPIPVSPFEDRCSYNNNNDSSKSSFEDLLTAMAVEAKETTERITRELKQMAEDKQKRQRDKEFKQAEGKQENEEKRTLERRNAFERKSPICTPDETKHNSLTRKEEKLSDIDAVSEHAKLCEKLIEAVVDSAELMALTRPVSENVEALELDPLLAKSIANEILPRDDSKIEKIVSKDDYPESEHDYENVTSDKELDEIPVIEASIETPRKCKSPFEEHKAELIATFQELTKENEKLVSKSGSPKSVSSKSVSPKQFSEDEGRKQGAAVCNSIYDNLDMYENTKPDETVAGEQCVGVVGMPPLETKCALNPNLHNQLNNTNHLQKFVSNCDIILRQSNTTYFIEPDIDDCLEDIDTSSGFHSNCSSNNDSHKSTEDYPSCNLHSLESLKSPKLVLATTSLCKVNSNDVNSGNRLSRSENNDALSTTRYLVEPGSSTESYRSDNERDTSNARGRREDASACHEQRHGDSDPKGAWYRDPANIALAFACVHQLASLDLLTILGILFAVISFIAALYH